MQLATTSRAKYYQNKKTFELKLEFKQKISIKSSLGFDCEGVENSEGGSFREIVCGVDHSSGDNLHRRRHRHRRRRHCCRCC